MIASTTGSHTPTYKCIFSMPQSRPKCSRRHKPRKLLSARGEALQSTPLNVPARRACCVPRLMLPWLLQSPVCFKRETKNWLNRRPTSSIVHRSPSTVHHPPSTVHRPRPTIHCPPSTVTIHRSLSTNHRSLSTNHRPLSSVHHPLFTIHWAVSTIQCPPSAVHSPPSSIHRSTSDTYIHLHQLYSRTERAVRLPPLTATWVRSRTHAATSHTCAAAWWCLSGSCLAAPLWDQSCPPLPPSPTAATVSAFDPVCPPHPSPPPPPPSPPCSFATPSVGQLSSQLAAGLTGAEEKVSAHLIQLSFDSPVWR